MKLTLFMKRMSLALVAAMLCQEGVAADGTAPIPAARARQADRFLQSLPSRLEPKLDSKNNWQMIADKIDWEKLRQDAQTTDPQIQASRLADIEFWQQLAKLHDYGMRCQRMNVFEWLACGLLAGKETPGKGVPEIAGGLSKDQACDYLLATELPTWAKSLRLCAAGVRMSNGDRQGFEILQAAWRSPTTDHLALNEVLWTTVNAKGLPLFAEAVKDPDPKIRRFLLPYVERVLTERSSAILVSLLNDVDNEVRMAAALALMKRDVREAAPVLLEKVNRELDGKAAAAHACAPICVKLQQWGIAEVPWEKIEAILKASNNETGDLLEVAGCCLAARRETVALPFLQKKLLTADQYVKKMNGGKKELSQTTMAWHAALILVANEYPDGVYIIGTYIGNAKDDWGNVCNGLMALATFANRPHVSPEDRQAIQTIAAKAVERGNELFQGYFGRGLEALAEMGALVRVERQGERLVAKTAIELPYDRRYGQTPHFMLAEICRAKEKSLTVAAKQDGIILTPDWLAAYHQEQLAAIAALVHSTDPELRNAAINALKELKTTAI